MDLTYTPEQQAFRKEARAWLEAHVPAEPLPSFDTAEGFQRHREWEANPARRALFCPHPLWLRTTISTCVDDTDSCRNNRKDSTVSQRL